MPWKETDKVEQRTQFALESLQRNVNFSDLCKRYGITRATGYKWKNRFLTQGQDGLSDESRRPKSSPQELPASVVCELVRLKKENPSWGPKKICELYLRAHNRRGPSVSTVHRVLKKAGLVEARRKRPQSQAGSLRQGLNAEAPNDLWTVDFKGWWMAGGMRCEPLTVRDDYSRWIFTIQSMPQGTGKAVRVVFERLFEQYGLPKAIRSDNGSPFASSNSLLGLSKLSCWWLALNVDLDRGRPGHPHDNGAHERMHRDIRFELQDSAASDLVSQQAALELWRRNFNEQRPHEALGMRTPGEVYTPSNRKYEGTPEDIEYPNEMISRRVISGGYIKVDGRRIFISEALQGWSVGLKYNQDTLFDVYYAKLRLGEACLRSATLLRAPGGPRGGRRSQN